ncbi:MAG: hypothetical protein E3J35_11100 [Methanomassiliicoccales archaeon]|nr:MAG: hypothetical protein E3J35_11100 [Methanomassiliicoccales archaeon]
MKKRGVSRCAALLVVLLMMMSAAIMLPSQNVTAQDHMIWGIVKDENCFDKVDGADVTLTDVHGSPFTKPTANGGIYEFTVNPGFYELTVSKNGLFSNKTGPFRFNGTEDLEITEFCMEPTPTKVNHITGTVLSSITNHVDDELVDFVTHSTTENVTGNFTYGPNTTQLSHWPVVENSYRTWWNNDSEKNFNLTVGVDYTITLWSGEIEILNDTIATELRDQLGWLNFTYDYSETASDLENTFVIAGYNLMKNNITWKESGNYTLDMDSGTIEIVGLENFTFGLDVLTVTYDYHPTWIQGATLALYNTTRDYEVSGDNSGSLGEFELDSWSGTFEIRVTADMFQPNVSQIRIDEDQNIRVLLDPPIWVIGWVFDSESQSPITDADVRAHMFCMDDVPKSKRSLKGFVDGPHFWFYSYPGNFTLIVDADGYKAQEMPILVQTTNQSHDVYLDLSEEEIYETSIEYIDNDWNKTIVNESWTLNMDSHLPILGTAQLGSLPLEIDLAVGDSNGTMSDPEFYTDFRDWLTERGPKFLKTAGLFLTDGEEYTLELDAGQVSKYYVDVEKGTEHIWINTSAWYNTSELIQDQEEYNLWLEAVYDSAINIDGEDRILANRTYRVTLPSSYELIANTSANTDVIGFTSIFIDSKKGSGKGTVTLRVQKSEGGIARAAVIGPKEEEGGLYYKVLSWDWDNYSAVVPADVAINFSAAQSTDNNSLPNNQVSPYSNFSWNFGDGGEGWGISPSHNYSDPGSGSGNYTVRLNVTEPGGNVTYTEINVKVDARVPTALAEFDERDTEVIDSVLHVDEDVVLRINATRDDLLSEDLMWDDKEGNMTYFDWDFDSDGIVDPPSSTEGQIETDFFTEPGEYTINLTITDWVGHKSENYSKKIIVDDTTPPDAVFFMLNETFASVNVILEGTSTYFNASDTTDNFSTLENLTFRWDLAGYNTTGVNVTHNFTETGTLWCNLTILDEAGNPGHHNISCQVIPNQKIHSDLAFEEAWTDKPILFEPGSPEVGTSVKISVNVTNSDVGVAAEGVQVRFWIVQADDATTEIAGTVRFYDENGTEVGNTIAAGEKLVAVITWNPGDHGVYTIRANCTAENEISGGTDDNFIEHKITVKEAGWVTPLITGVLILLIFIIAIVLLLRRRFGGKFPTLRRKKKPEKKEKKKERKKKKKKKVKK